MTKGIYILCAFACIFVMSNAMQCLDKNGSPVEWWIMLKYPSNSSTTNNIASQGYGYAYMDSNNKVLRDSGMSLRTNGGALQHTLVQVYNANSNEGWGMYNDDTNLCPSVGEPLPNDLRGDSWGHLKGVVGFDSNKAFWLVHSTPRFPYPKSKGSYVFPECAKDYGQSFICVSMTTSELEKVGGQLRVDHPQFYDSNMPASLSGSLPNLNLVFQNKGSNNDGSTSVVDIHSISGTTFTSFAKCAKWGDELYYSLVANYYSTDLLVETWMRAPSLPTWCKPQYEHEIAEISNIRFGEYSWPETKDHSKWAISTSKGVTCIGDINRMSSQATRGGGTLCIRDSTVTTQFKSIIANTYACNTPGK